MSPLVATYVCALLLLGLSLLVGRGVMLLFGRREASFIEGGVGIAALVLACSVAIRLPGRENTSLAVMVLLALAAAAVMFWRRDRVLGPNVGLAIAPAFLTVLLVSFPFLSSGHLGLPGVGVNNDMAMHLVFAEWLVDPVGATPPGILQGYPIGPQALVTTLTHALGSEPLRGFVGLIIAIPILTAIASLAVLRDLRPLPRILGAAFVPVAYLSASILGIAGFKEQLMALWLICTAIALREISRRGQGRVAMVIAIVAMCGGAIAAYSYPGLAWIVGAAAAWAAFELLRIRREGPPGRAREVIREALPVVGVVAGLLLLVALSQFNRIKEFLDAGAFDIVTGTASKLRFTVQPFEALGSWPSGNWLLGRDDVDPWWLFGALGVAVLVYAVAWAIRRGELALLGALTAAAAIYAGTAIIGERYVEAKALAIPASLIMLMALAALLNRDEKAGPLRIGLAVLFIGVSVYSSFLALRDTRVAPPDRFEELTALRDEVAGKRVIVFTSDRYTDYYLRGAEIQSPAINAELHLPGRFGKGQRLPVDFDSVFAKQLNDFDYAVTTRADYQSAPPPNFDPVMETDSYVLWKRTGDSPFVGVLAEEARPGRVFRCSNPKYKEILGREGIAITWPRPVIAKRLYWEPDGNLAPGDSASQSIVLPEGKWDLSIQYQTEAVPLNVDVGGETFEVKPGVEGAIPFRGAQGPFWRVGEIQAPGGQVEITVTAGELDWFQKLLGVDAEAEVGNVVATRLSDIRTLEFKQACGLYLDHYYTGKPGSLIAGPDKRVPYFPER
jgi:hypothetical protein